MSLPRIVVPSQGLVPHSEVVVPPDKSRYLLSVLRMRIGDRLTVTDGCGKAYESVIVSVKERTVRVSLGHEIPAVRESPAPLVLCQGVLKGRKMDMVIQKTTELGVSEIVPLITTFCVVRETRKADRWRKIAEEAAEQSGRTSVPRVHEPCELARFLQSVTPARDSTGSGLLFKERGGLPLAVALEHVAGGGDAGGQDARQVTLLVGPEGGFSEDEARDAEGRGFIPSTLGGRTLRAETAAIVAVAIVAYLLQERLSACNPSSDSPDLL
ncbi:MAG: 16S rRNA (uracil(1498)-N(3))-methyltransferase [Chloroflexota bacterium]